MKKYLLMTLLIFIGLCSSAYGEQAGEYRYIIGRGSDDVSFSIPSPASDLKTEWTAGGNGFSFTSVINTATGPVPLSFAVEDISSLSPATDIDGNESPVGHYDLYAPALLALAPDGSIYFKNFGGSFVNKAWQKPYINTEKGWKGDLLLADWGADRNNGNEAYGMCDLFLFLKDESGQYSKIMNARTEVDCRADQEAYKDLLNYIEYFQTGSRAVISEKLTMADGNTCVTQTSGGGSISFIDPTANAPKAPYRFFTQTIESPEGVFGAYSTVMPLSGLVKGEPMTYDCRLNISYQIRPKGSGDYLKLLGLTMQPGGQITDLKEYLPDTFNQQNVSGLNWSGRLIYNGTYIKSDKRYGAISFYVYVPSPLDVLLTLQFKKIPSSNLPAETMFADFQVTDGTLEDIKNLIKDIEVTTTRLDSETRKMTTISKFEEIP
jgi:hypothetical protein